MKILELPRKLMVRGRCPNCGCNIPIDKSRLLKPHHTGLIPIDCPGGGRRPSFIIKPPKDKKS